MGNSKIHELWAGVVLLIAALWAITQDIDRYAVVAVGVIGILLIIVSFGGADDA